MNLFVIPLDDERRWYRYHHLFAEVLRKRLEQHYPDSISSLHQRASQWFEQNGLIPEAIGHSLTAGDHDRAIQLIEQNGGLLIISGEVNTLAGWIKRVESQARTRPWIQILKGWVSAVTGFPERVEETLQTAERMIESQQPPTELNVMRGGIATARAYSTYQVGEAARAVSYARQALEYLTDADDLTSGILRTIAAALLGDASAMNGELEEARQAYLKAKQIGQAVGDIHLVILVNSNLGNVLVEQGRLREAMAIYSETLQIATRPNGKKLVIAGRVLGEMSQVSYEWNNLETAAEQARQGITLCNYWGAPEYEAVGLLALARAEQVRGNRTAALEAMHSAERLVSEHLLLPKSLTWANYALAGLWIAQGDFEKAARIVQAGGLTIDDEIIFQREPEFVVRLRLLLAQGDYDTSLSLSKRLLEKAGTGRQTGRVIEVLVLQALIFLGRQETEQALAALKKALALARPEGYIRTFVDEGEPMIRLLHLARSRHIETEYITDLLSAVEKTAGIAQPPAELLNEPLTAREIEVLKLIEAGCSNQEIAEKLVISFTTVKRHISNIYTKLDAKSRTQAIAIGRELKLFE
jgi:LuxR family maltose regulon positive regulatory protein